MHKKTGAPMRRAPVVAYVLRLTFCRIGSGRLDRTLCDFFFFDVPTFRVLDAEFTGREAWVEALGALLFVVTKDFEGDATE